MWCGIRGFTGPGMCSGIILAFPFYAWIKPLHRFSVFARAPPRVREQGNCVPQSMEDFMKMFPKWFVVVLALALIVGLTAPAMAADKAKGKIKSVTADKEEFVLTDANAKDWTFKMDDSGKVVLSDNKAGKLNDLKIGDEVTVSYKKQGAQLIATEVRCEKK
jgi:hypothetical protein